MTLKHFIERPVLASVISIVIVIAGIIGLATLPIEQYPDIAPPTVMVRASYPGASAETIQKSVIVPLEQAINGVEDMTYMLLRSFFFRGCATAPSPKSNILLCLKSKGFEFLSAIHLSLMKHLL